MGTTIQISKREVLESTIRLIYESLLKNRPNGRFFISGPDTASSTYIAAELGCKRKNCEFFTQEISGACQIDGALWYMEGAAHSIVKKVETLPGNGKYIVFRGMDSLSREELVKRVSPLVHFSVYGEEQFPNSNEKIVVLLE